jgi:hypothetical protein
MTWLTWAFCGHFAASWTHYLNEVYDATPVQTPLSLMFFEFRVSCRTLFSDMYTTQNPLVLQQHRVILAGVGA